MQSKDCLDGWTDKKDEWIDGGIDRYRHTDLILVYKLFISDPLELLGIWGLDDPVFHWTYFGVLY